MVDDIGTVFRDFNNINDPASGEYEPEKPRIRGLLRAIRASSGLAITRNTLAALTAVTPPTEDYMGVVLDDPDPANNGYYSRVAAAWVWERGFPDTFARVTLGGTANAQTGSVAAGVDPASTEVFFATVGTDNTGPMTLSVDGETARDVVNAAGNALSAGEWTGTVLFFINGDGDYQLLFDAGAAAAAAASASAADADRIAAELARDQAQAAASSVSPTEYPTIADAEALSPVSAPEFIRTAGYAAAGDGGGALYKQVVSEPTHAGKFSITLDDGVTVVWYEIASPSVNVKMFGATGDGVTDDRGPCQGAIDFVVAQGGGFVFFTTGEYLLTGVASPDSKLNGLVVPFSSFTVDNRVTLMASGLAVLKAGGDDMVIVRMSQPGSQLLGLDIDGNGHTGVWGVGMIAEDRTQTTTVVSQSFCRVDGCHVHDCLEGLVLEPGPDVSGSQSGAFYPVVTSNHFNLNTRSMWFKESNASTGVSLRPTRGNIAFNRIERGNVGVDLDYATEFQLTGNFFQFFKDTYSATPLANACAVHVGASSENNFLIGGANEASDNAIWNEGTLPNALQILFFPIGAVSIGLSFNPLFEAHAIRLTRRTSSYEALALTAHHSGFARLVFDYTGANVRDAAIETNSVKRMDWFNGKTTHYGSNGNIELLSTGSTISGTASSGLTVSTTGTNLSIAAGGKSALQNANGFHPGVDNTSALGLTAFRWTQLSAATATINTSDIALKDWRGALTDVEMRVAMRLSKLVGIYRWKEAIEAKGASARLHAGVIVQDVMTAFEAEGLDPFAYGMVCYDEWDDFTEPVTEIRDVVVTDKDGKPVIDESTGEPVTEPREVETGEIRVTREAGHLYGLRYDELWAFVAAGFEARLAVLEGA